MEALTPQVLISLVLFLFTIFIYYAWNAARPKPATPPSPPALPVIGHLHLLTDMPHHTFADLSNSLGPLIYLRLGQVPTIVIHSAHLAKLVLRTHDHAFANRPQLISAQYLSFGCSDVTFSSYGAYWRQARKICVTELLSAKRVHSFRLVRKEEVDRLLDAVLTSSGKEVDMSQMLFCLANDVLCKVAFGRRFMAEKDGKGKNLASVLMETQALFAGFCLGDFFPKWEWVNSMSGYRKRLLKNLKDLKEVCDEIIEEHLKKKKKKNGTENADDDDDYNEKEDFVDVLLRVQKREDLEVPITDDNLKALVLDMFVAGTDTSSATLEWVFTELARHPRVMKKAQEEVRMIASGNGKVDESDLQHLHYMKAVIKETMRLHPPVPLLVPRESMEKCALDGYEIPAKTRVLINTYAIGRDPKSWENPLDYDPERFMEDDIDFKDQDFRFLPFGGGRRGCPGYSFGLATIEITLARLLYHFDWALPHGVEADDVDLSEVFGLATRKKTALVLVPTANKDFQFRGHDF
ncbi:tryptamine 5-hydroxylase [Ricinus communis]|uniref:tryptamine 5-hydroxylase n=1 Tax=Ricinus communis TaxID=3988 RepID=UPI00201A40FB|nr:tryptamine 5-hydroxylase [Ricinus communis]